jgi:hypothetical protein
MTSKAKGQTNFISMEMAFMVANKAKIIILCLLILLGAALLAYGALFHSTDVLPQHDDGSAILAKSEPALIKEASIGGVMRDKSGKIKQTYTGEPPEDCPT